MNTKEILSKNLEELSEAKKDEDRTLSLVKQCKAMDINYQTFQKYYRGESSCPIENLIKIADYYDVSCDDLLNREKDPRRKPRKQDVVNLTGLNRKAVNELERIKSNIDNDSDLLNVINLIMKETKLLSLLNAYLLGDDKAYGLFDDKRIGIIDYNGLTLRVEDIRKVIQLEIQEELSRIRLEITQTK